MPTFTNTSRGRASTLTALLQPLKCEVLARPLLMLGLVLLLGSAAWAGIEIKPQYDVGEPIIVTVEPDNMPEGGVIRSAIFEVEGAAFEQVSPTKFHVWAKPGTYHVEAWGKWRLTKKITDKDGVEWDVLLDDDIYRFKKSFVVGEGDDPVPPPVPPGSRWAVIWEETEQRTPQQGNLFLQLRKEFQDERLLIKDVTNLPANLKALENQRPQNIPLPALMVLARQQDGTDKVVRTVALPSSLEGVKAEIAK